MNEPTIYTSYSTDGALFGLERPIKIGAVGDRRKRVIWWKNGHMRLVRVQKFRGTDPLTITRLEVNIEGLRY